MGKRPGPKAGKEFTNPELWHFRTLESWTKLLKVSGFRQIKTKEPVYPEINRLASLILIGQIEMA